MNVGHRIALATELPFGFTQLDVCGSLSCPGDHLSLICTLPTGHDGMHHHDGVPCSWEMAVEAIFNDDRARGCC